MVYKIISMIRTMQIPYEKERYSFADMYNSCCVIDDNLHCDKWIF